MTTTASTTRIPIITGAVLAGILAVVVPSASASAHTETDFVAVPAGATATVTFEPEHGCGDSPTVEVRIQAPVLGAVAEDVDGWTANATPDGGGNTVLRWTGGSTPADDAGAFPVEFTVPDTPGVLLAFPAVQTCEDGQELAWIGTAPGDEFPAPRLLVLPAGTEAAATIDDVPADAPGRDQLVALTEAEAEADDDDATAAPAATAAPTAPVPSEAAAAPTTAAPEATAAPTTAGTTPATTTATTPATAAATTAGTPTTTAGGDGGSSTGVVVATVVVLAAIIAGAAIVLVRRRRAG